MNLIFNLVRIAKITVVLLAFVLIGCAKDPRRDLQVLNQYKVGASRESLVAELNAIDAKCVESKTRPPEGWPSARDKKASAVARAAHRFEEQNPGVVVQLSEKYWVWRHYNYTSAFSVPGVWYDYLLFDKDNKLIAYSRVFAD